MEAVNTNLLSHLAWQRQRIAPRFSSCEADALTATSGGSKNTSPISNFNHFSCTHAVKLKFYTDIFYINVVLP